MKNLFIAFLMLLVIPAYAAKPKFKYVRIATPKGTCIVKLYNETPIHRDNFIKLTNDGTLTGTIFHRVIKDFMIQGGGLENKLPAMDTAAINAFEKNLVKAEINDSLFHKKGVLAAARTGDNVNPSRASSASQFYLVQGKVFTDSMLNQVETQRLKFKLPEAHRQVYKTLGGTPHLDRTYTVFGEIVKGIEMVDAIAVVPTAKANKPVEDIRMTVTVLTNKEAKKLEKELDKERKKKMPLAK